MFVTCWLYDCKACGIKCCHQKGQYQHLCKNHHSENEADEAYLSTYYEHFYRNKHLTNNTAICGTKILAQSLFPDRHS